MRLKKSKKILILLCVAAMAAFALTGCISGGTSSESADTSDESVTEESAETSDASTTEEPADGAVYDEIELSTAISSTENEALAMQVQHFADYISEKSGGKVTLKIYFGGSLCQDAEVPDYLNRGDLQISFVAPSFFIDKWPFVNSVIGVKSNTDTLDINKSLVADPEVGTLIQDQGAENNWRLLGHNISGANTVISKPKELKSWADAKGLKIGAGFGLGIYEAYGMSTATVEPPDLYDALSRGVIDCAAMSVGGIEGLKLYEVATNVADVRSYWPGTSVVVNLETWNSLSPDTQALLQEATDDWGEFSRDYADEQYDTLKTKIVDAGGTWNEFTEEDGATFSQGSLQDTVNMELGYAENLGCVDAYKTVVAKWAELSGTELTVD